MKMKINIVPAGFIYKYIVLMIVAFTIFIGITIYLFYYNWFLIKKNVSCIKFNTHRETKIW